MIRDDHLSDDLLQQAYPPPQRERIKTIGGVIREVVPLRESVFAEKRKLHETFGVAMTELRELAGEIQRFMRKAFAIDVARPTFPVIGLDEISPLSHDEAKRCFAARYEEVILAVTRMFECNSTGRVEWVDAKTVRFDYFTVRDKMNVFSWERERTKHTHELVQAISHPVTERNVPTDTRCRRLIPLLPKGLKPYARIITGLQVTTRQHATTEQHRTQLARAMSGAKDAAEAAHGAARGFLASTIAAAARAVQDPALVIGDVCLHGWE